MNIAVTQLLMAAAIAGIIIIGINLLKGLIRRYIQKTYQC